MLKRIKGLFHGSPRWRPAVGLSFTVHFVLLVLLSLIVLRIKPSPPPLTFHVGETADGTTLTEIPTFSLEPAADLSEQMAPPLELDLDIDVATPQAVQQLALGNNPPASAESSPSEQPSGDGEATADASRSLSAVAVSIQKRVSEEGGQRGEVQFALAWTNTNDVDLHVVTPAGEHISHLHKQSPTGGVLDVDMNVRGESDEPVENVRWLTGAPWGRYTIIINLFRIHRANNSSARPEAGSAFRLLAQLGSETKIEQATVTRNEQIAVFRFLYVPENVPQTKRSDQMRELTNQQQRDEAAAQPLLERATEVSNRALRERLLNNLISQYPHTDAAIRAMQLIGGSIIK